MLLMMKSRLLVAFAAVWVVTASACGGDSVEAPLPDRLTAEAPAPSPTQPAAGSPSTGAPSVIPTPAPTLPASVLGQVNALGSLVLGDAEVPAGFVVQRSDRALKADVVQAQIAIPELALLLRASDLAGAWGALYTRTDQAGQAGISSIVYLFGTPEGAQGFVEATANITDADYVGALEVAEVQADDVGDASHLFRYRLIDGRSLEYTWAQGQLAGQIILRYTQDAEAPDDPITVAGLARIQAVKMAAFLP